MIDTIKVAIIGCGQISEAHIKEIGYIKNASIVAVCDLYKELAEDTAERYNIKSHYTDYIKMINSEEIDVVHITTPPHTHLEIGKKVLEHGCHIYVEKPFCISKSETEELLDCAKKNNLIVCPGYSQTMDIATFKLKSFFEAGELGQVVHVESYYGDSLKGDFSKIFINTKSHWIHQLPGKVIQNVITHALYNIIPFFQKEINDVSGFSYDRSCRGIFDDELRILIRSDTTTGYITYTSSVEPVRQFLRVYGSCAIATVDFTNHIFSVIRQNNLPGSLQRVTNAVCQGSALIVKGLENAKNFITGNDRFFTGMGRLFNNFYMSIQKHDNVPPIPYGHIIKVADLMDKINKKVVSYKGE